MTPRTKEAKSPIKLVRSGIFALRRKKWAKAQRKFEAALEDEEIQQNAIVWANYGIALTNLRRLKEAQQAFLRATSIDKKNAELWTKKGLIESQLDSFKEAQQSFEKAMKFDKTDPELPILLSRIHRKQGDLNKALKILEVAHKKLPESHQIPIEIASIYSKRDEEKKLIKILMESIDSAKKPDPGLLLGQKFLDNKEYSSALTTYEAILKKFPNSQHAQYGIGVAYHAGGNYPEALTAYERSLEMFRPNKPPQSLLVNMARVQKKLGKPKEAIDTLYQAKKLDKTTLEILLLLTELFLEIDRPDRARRVLEDATNLERENPLILFYLGMTLLKTGNAEEAKKIFNKSLEIDPNFQESKLQLALLAIADKNLRLAYSYANEAANSEPPHIPAKKLAAKLAFDFQDYKNTISLLTPLIEQDKSLIEEFELVLRSWLLLSQPERAKEFYTKIIQKDPILRKKLTSKVFFEQFE